MTPNRRISLAAPLIALLLAGCDTPAPGPGVAGENLPVTSAYFTQDPELVIDSARKACDSPNEEFIRPRAGVAQCRLLMDPESTAAVILQFDGDIKNLPQLVISLSKARANDGDSNGYVISGCAFLKVPQHDGKVLRVMQDNGRVQAKLRQMLEAVGGKPVRNVPRDIAERCFSL